MKDMKTVSQIDFSPLDEATGFSKAVRLLLPRTFAQSILQNNLSWLHVAIIAIELSLIVGVVGISANVVSIETGGWLILKLPKALPHIVLDAEANNNFLRLTNLPQQFLRGQRLELEGDFGKYFTLYCPNGMEHDALYIFTPDVMQVAIDGFGKMCDIEIKDDQVYICNNRPFTLHAASIKKLYQSAESLHAELAKQAKNYRHSSLAAASVASVVSAKATPLKRTWHWTKIWYVMVVLYALSAICIWAAVSTDNTWLFNLSLNLLVIGAIGTFAGMAMRYKDE